MGKILGVWLVSAFSAGAAAAQGSPAWTFADCAGRFSAEMEHAWLMQREGAVQHDARRRAFVTLIAASAGDIAPRMLLAHQIEAKQAHAQLIQAATFQTDPRQVRFARTTAAAYIGSCERLLLGG